MHEDLLKVFNAVLNKFKVDENLYKLEIVSERQFKFYIDGIEFRASHTFSGNILQITTYRNGGSNAIQINTLTFDGSQDSFVYRDRIFDFKMDYFDMVSKSKDQN